MTKQQEWENKQVAKGRCATCGEETPINKRTGKPSRLCEKHLKIHAEYMQGWRSARSGGRA